MGAPPEEIYGIDIDLNTAELPRPVAQIRKTPPETIAALGRFLETHTDAAVARELNRAGHTNWKGES